jgi:hypothetical protein
LQIFSISFSQLQNKAFFSDTNCHCFDDVNNQYVKALTTQLGSPMKNSIFALFAPLLASTAYAAPLKDIEAGVDLSLVYVDSAPNMRGKDKSPSFTQETDDPRENRSLGLRHMKLSLSANTPHSSGVFLQFRPDAELRTREPTEFDSRAGSAYRPAPSLELLNTYYIRHSQGDDARYEIGVFGSSDIEVNAYEPIHQFGLETILPQNFAAARASFIIRRDKSSVDPSKGVYLDFSILQGREDRGETYGYVDSSFDGAPTGQDPYVGASASVSFVDKDSFGKLALLAGTIETRIEPGRVSEIFSELAYAHETRLILPVQIGLESKISVERWRNTEAQFADLTQSSLFASSTIELRSENWLALGGHYGKSQRHSAADSSEVEVYSGWALDIGYIHALSPNSKVSAAFTTEKRSKTADGETTGGFESASLNRSQIHRVGLELRYLL